MTVSPTASQVIRVGGPVSRNRCTGHFAAALYFHSVRCVKAGTGRHTASKLQSKSSEERGEKRLKRREREESEDRGESEERGERTERGQSEERERTECQQIDCAGR